MSRPSSKPSGLRMLLVYTPQVTIAFLAQTVTVVGGREGSAPDRGTSAGQQLMREKLWEVTNVSTLSGLHEQLTCEQKAARNPSDLQVLWELGEQCYVTPGALPAIPGPTHDLLVQLSVCLGNLNKVRKKYSALALLSIILHSRTSYPQGTLLTFE